MHPNQRVADIHAGSRPDLLNGNRMLGILIYRHGKSSTRVESGNDIADLGSQQKRILLHDNRAIQVFTALGCEVYSLLV